MRLVGVDMIGRWILSFPFPPSLRGGVCVCVCVCVSPSRSILDTHWPQSTLISPVSSLICLPLLLLTLLPSHLILGSRAGFLHAIFFVSRPGFGVDGMLMILWSISVGVARFGGTWEWETEGFLVRLPMVDILRTAGLILNGLRYVM